MMIRQAEAAPLTQITTGSGGVGKLHVGWDAFYEKFETTFFFLFWRVHSALLAHRRQSFSSVHDSSFRAETLDHGQSSGAINIFYYYYFTSLEDRREINAV